jgi:hypothetical protein
MNHPENSISKKGSVDLLRAYHPGREDITGHTRGSITVMCTSNGSSLHKIKAQEQTDEFKF